MGGGGGGWLIPIGHQTIRECIVSCPTFVQKHGELGRAMAGWLHKVFATQVLPFVFPCIIFLWWTVLKGGG